MAGNLFIAIGSHLRGKRCRVFKGDMKVRLNLNEKDLFYYPDVMVVCDPADSEPYSKTRPKLIVEVMSEYKLFVSQTALRMTPKRSIIEVFKV